MKLPAAEETVAGSVALLWKAILYISLGSFD